MAGKQGWMRPFVDKIPNLSGNVCLCGLCQYYVSIGNGHDVYWTRYN